MKAFLLLAFSLLAMGVQAGGAALLTPQQAFSLDLERSESGLTLVADVTPGYALYRDRIEITGFAGVTVSRVELPAGHVHDDPALGPMRLLDGQVRIPIRAARTDPSMPARISVRYLGCKLDEYCFPPQRVQFDLGSAP